ncbi:hypothetical protein GCM10023186_08450 [Hymenobacter koreensis]|uniref:Uncharacterized protein n=1 Tax=Hymenobacter koreensis TaxID=1084523 RepID=A0ABP8IWG5_9BACT
MDGLGALLSAVLLGGVLVRFESVFGMPQKALYFLSLVALLFFIYSVSCALSAPRNWRLCLRIIASLNLLYCGVTIGLMVYWHHRIMALGWLYFAAECVVIVTLAVVELKAASAASA